jgi:hypothetical protein
VERHGYPLRLVKTHPKTATHETVLPSSNDKDHPNAGHLEPAIANDWSRVPNHLVLVPRTTTTRVNTKLRGSSTTRILVEGVNTLCIGWDMPHLTINGLPKKIFTPRTSLSSTSPRSIPNRQTTPNHRIWSREGMKSHNRSPRTSAPVSSGGAHVQPKFRLEVRVAILGIMTERSGPVTRLPSGRRVGDAAMYNYK